jgi:hypothetical protein
MKPHLPSNPNPTTLALVTCAVATMKQEMEESFQNPMEQLATVGALHRTELLGEATGEGVRNLYKRTRG